MRKSFKALASALSVLLLSGCFVTSRIVDSSTINLARHLEPKVGELLYKDSFTCSVFYVGNNTFVTAEHCVKDRSKDDLTVYLGGRSYGVLVMGIGTDVEDWAVLTVLPKVKAKPLEIDCSARLERGMFVAYLGYPAPMIKDFSIGVISSTSRVRSAGNYGADYFIDTLAGGGASGSPLVNSEGKVIGIIVEQFFNDQRTTFRLGIQSIEQVCKYIG